MLEDSLPKEELDELKTECLRIVEEIEESIQKIKSSDSALDLDLIDNLFRSYHNLKGMSGFMGIHFLKVVTSESESILAFHRKRNTKIDLSSAKILSDSVRLIKIILEDQTNITDDEIEVFKRQVATHCGSLENQESSLEDVALKKEHLTINIDDFSNADIGEVKKIFDIIFLHVASISKGNHSKSNIQNLYEAFHTLHSISSHSNNLKIIHVTSVLNEFFYSYSKDLAMPFSFVSRVQEIIDYCFGLFFLQKNALPDSLLKNQEQNTISFQKDFKNFLDNKKNDLFERAEDVSSFSFRISTEDIINITDSIVRTNSNMSKVENALNERSEFDNPVDFNDFVSNLKTDFENLNQSFFGMQELIYKITRVPLKHLFYRFVRVIENAANLMNKKIEFKMEGESIEIDKSYLNSLNISIIHILRNACDHGIETIEERINMNKNPVGLLEMLARLENDKLEIIIKDDGRGLDRNKIIKKLVDLNFYSPEAAKALSDQEVLMNIFRPGFSTSNSVTEISGRGVGMDIVNTEVSKLGGKVSIDSKIGLGLSIKIELPYKATKTKQ